MSEATASPSRCRDPAILLEQRIGPLVVLVNSLWPSGRLGPNGIPSETASPLATTAGSGSGQGDTPPRTPVRVLVLFTVLASSDDDEVAAFRRQSIQSVEQHRRIGGCSQVAAVAGALLADSTRAGPEGHGLISDEIAAEEPSRPRLGVPRHPTLQVRCLELLVNLRAELTDDGVVRSPSCCAWSSFSSKPPLPAAS